MLLVEVFEKFISVSHFFVLFLRPPLLLDCLLFCTVLFHRKAFQSDLAQVFCMHRQFVGLYRLSVRRLSMMVYEYFGAGGLD